MAIRLQDTSAASLEDRLGEPGHRVQFYEDDAFLVTEMARFVGAGLGAGERVVVIATPEHRDGLKERLASHGLDLGAAREQERYLELDAAETLATFMLDESPDAARFLEVMGSTIASSTDHHPPRVRLFGEMVSLLWAAGNREAALRLEELWNDLARTHSFSLLCAYPMIAFDREADHVQFLRICGEHAHVAPAESFPLLASTEERLRAIARLQQKGSALDKETAEREQAERALRERLRDVQLLVMINRELARSLELAELLPTLCRLAREVTGADGAAFVLREGELVEYVAEDAIAPLWKGERFPISACISGWSMLEQSTAVVDDVYADARIPIEAYRRTFVKSLAMVPVRRADPLGAVGVYWGDRHRATEREVALLEALADAASVAVINAQLFAAARTARVKLEAESRAKDAFLATVSHELRTPLSPILTWTRMLKAGTLDDEKEQRALDTIERCARAQAQLIEDLLDVSRIIAGKLRLEARPIRLGPVIEAAVEIVRPALDAKGVFLRVLLEPESEPIFGDAERLQQVVWNLLSNAVKFTAKGGSVTVALERAEAHFALTVRDTGAGISPAFLPHIFERFQQADVSASRAHGGLGLGLAIVRHIVEAHGGTVQAESAGEGHGATFTVSLPVTAAQAVADGETRPATSYASATPYPSLAALRVLVVDDQPDTSEIVRELLVSCGADVEVACSAEDARAVLQRWKADVLVSDIGMPGEDGYAFLANLRAQNGDMARLPAVALTAYASRSDKIRLLAAGFQAYVPKPLDPIELVTVVANLARTAGRA